MPQNYLILNTKTGKVIYSSRENRQFSVVVSRFFVPEAGVVLLLGQGPKNPQKKLTSTVPILAGFDAETGAEIFRREAFQSSNSEQLVPVGMVSEGERVFTCLISGSMLSILGQGRFFGRRMSFGGLLRMYGPDFL